MSSTNIEDESEKRERFHTCSEDTVEEMEKFFDKKEEEIECIGSDNTQKQNQNYKSPTHNKRRKGRPRVNINEKPISKKAHDKRNKKYGFVSRYRPRNVAEEKSPPAKAKRVEVENRKDVLLNESEDEDKDEINEVFEKEKENVIDDNGVKENIPNKKCIDCDQMYYDKAINNEIKRKCKICMSNEHGCLKETYHEKSKGDMWLCMDCLELTNMIEKLHPDLFPNLRNTLVKKGTKRKRTIEDDEISASSKRKIEETKTKEKRVSFKTSSISLFNTTINNEDLTSLEEGHWINDSVISLWFEYLQNEVCDEKSNILFIPPSVTQLLKEGVTDDFSIILEPLNIWKKKYIFLAVSDNKIVSKVGGQHWSLLMYTLKENMWYHYDSLNNLNLREARYLVGRVQDYLRPETTPKITEAVCSQQGDNYDCGAYIMAYTQEIVRRLKESSHTSVNKCIVDKNIPNQLRNKIRCMIQTKMSDSKTDQIKDDDEEDRDKNKIKRRTEKLMMKSKNEEVEEDEKVDDSKNFKDPKIYPNLNKDKICYFLTKGHCKYGAKGENHLGKCIKYHPDQCREYNLNGTMEKGCKKGNKCEKWHSTYFCHLSSNSKTCKRVDCYFKHHKNCKVTKSEYFLDPKKENRRPLLPQGPQYPTYNKWQNHHQPQHQQHSRQSHHQYHQYHQIGNNFHHQQQAMQTPQIPIPFDQLKQVIQTVIHEMNTY